MRLRATSLNIVRANYTPPVIVGGNPIFAIPDLSFYYTTAEDLTLRADNDPITSIADLRPSGSIAFSNTGTARPTWKTGGKNGKPYLSFDGIDDVLDGSGPFLTAGNNDLSIFCVLETDTVFREIWSYGTGGSTGRLIGLRQHDTTKLRNIIWSRDFENTGITTFENKSFIHEFTHQASVTTTSSNVWVDGLTITANRTDVTLNLPVTPAQIRIGRDGGTPYGGKIYAFIAFNKQLTTGERTTVINHLHSLYGAF